MAAPASFVLATARACSSNVSFAPWPSIRATIGSFGWATSKASGSAATGRKLGSAGFDGPFTGLHVWSILLHPADPDLMIVGTCPSRLFRSADAGRTWTEADAAIRHDCPRILATRVTTLKGDPRRPEVIYAGVEIDGLHRSVDGGRTFKPIGDGMSSRDIHDLAIVGPDSVSRSPTTTSTAAPTAA